MSITHTQAIDNMKADMNLYDDARSVAGRCRVDEYVLVTGVRMRWIYLAAQHRHW